MPQQRLYFIDNLRLMVIILVVAIHAEVTYSGLGSWYYKEPLPMGVASKLFFAVSQCFLQAFFMGALFMVAGYFAAASLRSRGTLEFLRGRFLRLGLPTLFYMLVIHPLTVYYLMDWDHTRFPVAFVDFYEKYITSLSFLAGTGPMWFALALLLFCVVYALARVAVGSENANGSAANGQGADGAAGWTAAVSAVAEMAVGVNVARRSAEGRTTAGAAAAVPTAARNAVDGPPPAARPFPARLPLTLALAVSAGAFGLRLLWPIGTSISNMQLCFFSQYVLLFCFGIAAHANGWLERLDSTLGRRCLMASAVGIPLLLAFFMYGGALAGNEDFRGGLNWQSLFFSVWESCTGVFMSLGLAALLRRYWNSQSAFVKGLSASAFAVYMFHAPILVLLSQLLRPVELAALPKFLLVFALALPLSFGAARIIRATPLLRDMVRS